MIGAGIDEVRLALGFAAAEIRDHELVALLKVHRRAGEVESLVHVVAEWAAEKNGRSRIVSKPVAWPFCRIIVAARVEEGQLVAPPILVDRQLERGHLRE